MIRVLEDMPSLERLRGLPSLVWGGSSTSEQPSDTCSKIAEKAEPGSLQWYVLGGQERAVTN